MRIYLFKQLDSIETIIDAFGLKMQVSLIAWLLNLWDRTKHRHKMITHAEMKIVIFTLPVWPVTITL